MKQLWILAGGNGAGKSTFYDLMLAPLGIPFINADFITKEFYSGDPEGNSLNPRLTHPGCRYRSLSRAQ